MEHLPPDRWDELATKRQLDQLNDRFDRYEQRMDDRFAALTAHVDERFEDQYDRWLVALHERIDRQTRLLLFTILGALVTMALVGVVGG